MNLDAGISTKSLVFNFRRQKAWLAHYLIVDPHGAGVKTTNDILQALQRALKARGIRC